jgi:hypothetical protein
MREIATALTGLLAGTARPLAKIRRAKVEALLPANNLTAI